MMRNLLSILISLLLAGCSAERSSPSVPPYNTTSFRSDIERLITQKNYSGAITYLQSADAELQSVSDGAGYLAVAEDMIVLPGVESSVSFDAARDWLIPGTSDTPHPEWQRVATEFATAYNRKRMKANQALQATAAPLGSRPAYEI